MPTALYHGQTAMCSSVPHTMPRIPEFEANREQFTARHTAERKLYRYTGIPDCYTANTASTMPHTIPRIRTAERALLSRSVTTERGFGSLVCHHSESIHARRIARH